MAVPEGPSALGGRSDYVVIGSGPAGTRAAETLRRRERSARIVVVAADPNPFYNRILLSKDFLRDDGVSPASVVLAPAEAYASRGIELWSGTRVLTLDPSVRELRIVRAGRASAETLRYGKCLVASGARPHRLPVPGGDLPGVHYLRSLDDAVRLREAAAGARRAVVVGGGLIGVEVAAALTARGIACALLAREAWLLGHMAPEPVGHALERVLREGGIELRLATTVTSIQPVGEGERRAPLIVVAADGRRFQADFVPAGVGVAPAVGFLAGSGLASPEGLHVDERQRTAAPGVWAAGDAACFFDPVLGARHRVEHWLHAQHHGRAAAENMTGGERGYARVTWYETELFGVTVMAFGAPTLATEWVERGDLATGAGVAFGLRNGRAVAAFRVGDAGEPTGIAGRIEAGADGADLEVA